MMIIDCGENRRIVRYRYGWKLERKTEEGNWKEDSPAWPATLAQACENMAERIMADDQERLVGPWDLAAELAHAVTAIEDYFARARQIGRDFEENLKHDSN